MKVAVIGAGAIGGYYGGKLAHAGIEVHFLVRSDLEEFRRKGLHIHGRNEDLHVSNLRACDSPQDIGPCDLVLIAVKTISNAEIVEAIGPLLGRDTMVLTLQNGLGNEEFFAARFGAERILGGLCFICLTRKSRTLIEHYDKGRLSVGEYLRQPMARTRATVELFALGEVSCDLVDDLALERWRKLVWNVPFNGLAVTEGGLDTAAIMADATLREHVLELMHEVIAAANKCGHALPESEAAEQLRRTEDMGAYKPSTLIDWQAGKPLEVDAIWGEPLRRGRAAGADMPLLGELYDQLIATQSGATSRNIDKLRA